MEEIFSELCQEINKTQRLSKKLVFGRSDAFLENFRQIALEVGTQSNMKHRAMQYTFEKNVAAF